MLMPQCNTVNSIIRYKSVCRKLESPRSDQNNVRARLRFLSLALVVLLG